MQIIFALKEVGLLKMMLA